ncbi:MAG TPA: kelch repeat-containing protein [Pyrinomonadaceae bacterium]|nr:kelch repeat-containing protein [Pyrinomonadaceae bacterium]
MKSWHRTISFLLLLIFPSVASSCTANSVGLNASQENSSLRDSGAVNAIRNMRGQRAAHTATLLADGGVLVAGGFAGAGGSLASVEIFDPATEMFAPAENLNAPRAGHSATLLSNGKVLIAGGYNGNYLASAELYDPAVRRFTPTSRMVTARSGHVAVLLPNGKVLLAGGVGTGWTFLADAELYDPATNGFTATGNMLAERESHTATLLANGNVLITGGHKGRRAAMTIYSSAEIYDLAAGKFSETGEMTRVRHKHDAVLLADGRVLIVAGADERDGRPAYTSAEIYNALKGTFTATASLNSPRYKLQGTSILLNNGRVLVAGGADRAEVFDPSRNTFSYASGDMGTPRLFATATRLRNGQVLITGGYHAGNEVSSQAWIYRA